VRLEKDKWIVDLPKTDMEGNLKATDQKVINTIKVEKLVRSFFDNGDWKALNK